MQNYYLLKFILFAQSKLTHYLIPKFTFILTLTLLLSAKLVYSQQMQDSVVQLYGVVMAADSLKPIPSASIIVENKNRGTISNPKGVFSIVALKGDKITISSVGYKPVTFIIPIPTEGNRFSIVQLLEEDIQYLPATILKPRPTREQFERDFVNVEIPNDELIMMQKNTSKRTLEYLAATIPLDGSEATNAYLRTVSQNVSTYGQVQTQNIFNPLAWAQFIKAWKRGDYKKRK